MASIWKTFVLTPLIGAVAALVGWTGAVLFRESMRPAEFATLRFGWAGLMIGATATAILVILYFINDVIEPLPMTVAAGVGVALLWNTTTFPIDFSRFVGSEGEYWFILAMASATMFVLIMGLRAARETTRAS